MRSYYEKSRKHFIFAFTILALGEMLLYFISGDSWQYYVLTAAPLLLGWILFLKNNVFSSDGIQRLVMACCVIFINIVFGVSSLWDLHVGYVFYIVAMMFSSSLGMMGLNFSAVAYVSVLLVQFIMELIKGYEILEIISLSIEIILMICVYYFLRNRVFSRQELIREYERSGKVVEVAKKNRDEFMAGASHHLRTPLNAIMGLLEQERATRGDESGNLLEIRKSAETLYDIVTDVIDYSELRAGGIIPAPGEYSLNSLMDDLMNTAIHEKGEKDIDILLSVYPGVPKSLIGDMPMIRRALEKIIQNAVRYTQKGYVYIDIAARRESYGVNLTFKIFDTGVGISEEMIEELMGQEEDESTYGSKNASGIGIGISLARGYLSILKGMMHITSSPGQGTQVFITIPQRVRDASPLLGLEEGVKARPALMISREAVSDVNVSIMYRKVIADLCYALGMNLREYYDPTEVVNAAGRGGFTHLILLESDRQNNSDIFEKLPEDIKVIPLKKDLRTDYIVKALNGRVDIRLSDTSLAESFMATGAGVLVVDDNGVNIKVLEGYLKPYGIQVFSVRSGREALEFLESARVDMIFLDRMMPEMDGEECFRRIRQKEGDFYKNVPIVAVTADVTGGVRERLMEAGFNGFLSKPIDREELAVQLKKHLPEKYITTESNGSEDHYKPVVDKALGLEMSLGSEELYAEIVGVYLEESGANIDNLNKHLSGENPKEYAVIAHAIKSNSLQIGVPDFSEEAKALEMAGKAGDLDYIKQNHDTFISHYKKVIALFSGEADCEK